MIGNKDKDKSIDINKSFLLHLIMIGNKDKSLSPSPPSREKQQKKTKNTTETESQINNRVAFAIILGFNL
jgi:hypothetical protein